MKLWKRIIEQRLKREIMRKINLVSGKSIIETLYLMKHLNKRCCDKQKVLHIVLVNLEKAYEKVLKSLIVSFREEQRSSCVYTKY